VEKALGGYDKKNYKSEDVLVSILGKSLVANKALKTGHIITKDDLTTKGPPTGIRADQFFEVIGKKIITDKEEDEIIFPGDIK
jgi:sialic acid synthase SpsE